MSEWMDWIDIEEQYVMLAVLKTLLGEICVKEYSIIKKKGKKCKQHAWEIVSFLIWRRIISLRNIIDHNLTYRMYSKYSLFGFNTFKLNFLWKEGKKALGGIVFEHILHSYSLLAGPSKTKMLLSLKFLRNPISLLFPSLMIFEIVVLKYDS